MKKLSVVFNALQSSVLCIVLFMSVCMVGFTSCSDDDAPTGGLVSSEIPSVGWSGSTDNGIATYRPDTEEDEITCYYAFSFENGKCKDAVFNMVCENEVMAKYLAKMLTSGKWAEEDDDEEYSMSQFANNPVLMQALRSHKSISSAAIKTRSANVMGITCTQEGKVVYFRIEAVKGLDGEVLGYVMNTWDTGLNVNTLPEKPIFGTWDEATGKYISNSIYAIPGTKIEIEIAFNQSDILIKYTATFTLPNEMWAEMIEEALREQASGLEALAGIELEITRNGNVVTSNNLNVETANTTKADILKLIIAMDILNARPIVTAIF